MGRLRDSLNKEKGTTINELEAFMILMEKLIEEKLAENPKAGMIIAKGQPNEIRVRYKKALGVLHRLHGFFALKGCFSIGICQTCSSFNQAGYSAKLYGKCKGREKNWCDTCDDHSDSGGGFGKDVG